MTVTLHLGDCLDVMRSMPDGCVDAVVTDPPYGLSFMGKGWDHGVPGVEFWVEALRVAKPGAHILAFGGTRTYHRLACAIEDAGWRIVDCLSWIYGSGFPKHKSLLKPAWEPVVMGAKAGRRVVNIEECRIGTSKRVPGWLSRMSLTGYSGPMQNGQRPSDGGHNPNLGRWPANVMLDEWHEPVLRLKNSVIHGTVVAIEEYFHDYRLPGVPVEIHDVSEQAEEPEGAVLLPRLLREASEPGHAGQRPSHVRSEAQAGVARADEQAQEGDGATRGSQPPMEGRSLHLARLRDDRVFDAEPRRAGAVCVDGKSEQQQRDPGAPSGDGSEALPPAGARRDRSSPQRDQERQPATESGDVGQRDAQARPQCDPSRASIVAPGKRTIEVLARDVPMRWRHHFIETGWAVRCGAAAALDEQSGTLTSGGGDKASFIGYRGGANGGAPRVTSPDSGGASRFFYVAKASRAEREHGLDHLPDRSLARGNQAQRADRDGGSVERADVSSGLGATYQVKNHHPTVKPVALMRWLVRLVTPPEGVVLDPFMGSGTTGVACIREGRSFVGIEREPEYHAIAEARIAHARGETRPDAEQPGLDFGVSA